MNFISPSLFPTKKQEAVTLSRTTGIEYPTRTSETRYIHVNNISLDTLTRLLQPYIYNTKTEPWWRECALVAWEVSSSITSWGGHKRPLRLQITFWLRQFPQGCQKTGSILLNTIQKHFLTNAVYVGMISEKCFLKNVKYKPHYDMMRSYWP